MPPGTIDRTPPPFFRQGPSALTKVALCSALALFLMAADTRFALVQPLRAAVATALLPLQRALLGAVDLVAGASSHVRGLQAAKAGEDAARAELASLSLRTAEVERLAAENARLRALLELRPALAVRSTPAQVMYEAPDPYSRKLFIDRGATHGVALGSPVVNEAGVLGQVTQVYPLTSLVTLLTDREAAIPVLNARTQQRSAAFGGVEGGLELRYLAGNADVQVGDVLHTAGIDGVYPPGLVVGRVERVDRRAESGFARILVSPAARLDGVRHVLVLTPVGQQVPEVAEAENAAAKPAKADPPARPPKGDKADKGETLAKKSGAPR
jgi:rod shape-determining protein MreC